MSTATVTLEDVERARDLLEGVARRTPLEGSRSISERVGGQVRFKCENLQRTGSFKIRGAYVRIANLTPAERANGVVAASAGNHAQGVALAASLLESKSTVFMPEGAPLPKVAATEAYGAHVRFAGHTVDEALIAARAFATDTGATFIHPFDHPDVIAGQGTVGLEILEQCPEVRTIVVSVGGGGLLAGLAAAVKAVRPDVRVIGVQAAGAAAYPPSMAAGKPVQLAGMATMADGIAVGQPGDLPFDLITRLVDEIRVVSEESLSKAMLALLERAKLVVEPAGAAAVAAVMDDARAFDAPVVALLSGGNIDPLLMMRMIRHGLVSAGRFLALRLRIPDRPGALAKLLSELGEADANVMDIEHLWTRPSLAFGEVEVALQLETRGIAHAETLISRLRAAGYQPEPTSF
ncbi:threonine ammonia-lyase [Catenulispora rubra]|uniref:threonine ammonia-lyase n=1 Tax=Catenulispora rubra TaxID=280293 RepID=UPI0018923B99|nr:threonine ammonia-lyase [Catenulispora rubra]